MTSFPARVLAAVLACGLSGACASRAAIQPALQEDEASSERDDAGHKSYILPVVEIIGMDAGINRVGSMILDPATFAVTVT